MAAVDKTDGPDRVPRQDAIDNIIDHVLRSTDAN